MNGYYTSVIPAVKAKSPVATESVNIDNSLHVVDNTIFASGATIEVFDIMGRRIAEGLDAVTIEYTKNSIFVVKTKYVDGVAYMTKIVIR